MITQSKLKEQLDYNQDTGVFTWLSDNKSKKVKGLIAGTLNQGYNIIRIKNKSYLTHRLAWLYIYGEWPNGQIDHINGVRNDNRIENLRDVSHRQNGQNQKKHREGKLVGANYDKERKKWRSSISINGKLKHLGRFDTEEEAHEAYLIKFKELTV